MTNANPCIVSSTTALTQIKKTESPSASFSAQQTPQHSITSPVEKAAPAWSYHNMQRSLALSLYQPIVKYKSFGVPVRWPGKTGGAFVFA